MTQHACQRLPVNEHLACSTHSSQYVVVAVAGSSYWMQSIRKQFTAHNPDALPVVMCVANVHLTELPSVDSDAKLSSDQTGHVGISEHGMARQQQQAKYASLTTASDRHISVASMLICWLVVPRSMASHTS